MPEGDLSRNPVPRWAERLARVGYATKGVVYLLIGALAVLAALDAGKQPTDTRGAFQEVYSKPFGRVLLSALAVGLAAYGLYMLIEAKYHRIRAN
jgi:hypothetical protein